VRSAHPPYRASLAIATAAVALISAFAMASGSFAVPAGDVARVLWSALAGSDAGVADNVRAVVLDIRGPRVLAALAVGAALAAAGATFQGLFRNALVAPDILGVSAGVLVIDLLYPLLDPRVKVS